jgi:7,8-dihydropterin-6-yl-methyl-4-(beta-D-ribofuranosyl)aminobenzene 5'-phosphate synthase
MAAAGALGSSTLRAQSATTAPTSIPGRVQARTVKITVLSTMLAGDPRDKGIGEWGFAALVEVDGRRILYDTGERPETVLHNAHELGIDLSDVTDVVLSHSHWDHVGGLLTLRRELAKTNQLAMSRAHVAPGIFLSRRSAHDDTTEANPVLAIRPQYEATGGVFVEHRGPEQIAPGVWLSGPVPRRYQERNWFRDQRIHTPAGFVEDTIPEDQALIIDTPRGLVVLTGCGHAGIVNIVTYAATTVRQAPIIAVVGGLHLFASSDSALAWTAARLHDAGMQYLLGAHCTGIEAVFRIRALAGLTRRTAVVAAVGSSYSLDSGINPLLLAN